MLRVGKAAVVLETPPGTDAVQCVFHLLVESLSVNFLTNYSTFFYVIYTSSNVTLPAGWISVLCGAIKLILIMGTSDEGYNPATTTDLQEERNFQKTTGFRW